MAKVTFVGFQEKIEIPEGFQLLKIEESIKSLKSRDELYSLLTEPPLISRWLFDVQSFDSRPGGKLIFSDGSEAICTSFVLGKEVSLIADSFGNFTAKVVKKKEENSLHLKFAILIDEVEQKTKEIIAIIDRLKLQL